MVRLDLEKLFGRKASLHVDLGCGDGSFLCELAQRLPEKNFLAIERLSRRVEKARRKAARIDNVRVLRAETSYVMRYLLPENSVETFYLLFPDPWPKRRHQQRRIFSRDFLDSIANALEEDGLLCVATDQPDYFRQIERLSRANPRFEIVDPSDVAQPAPGGQRLQKGQDTASMSEQERLDDPADSKIGCPSGAERIALPLTKFEQRFREQGAPIHRLTLRKVSPVK
jgi:tRNA (guanine-N(7)-)-methyltransferase